MANGQLENIQVLLANPKPEMRRLMHDALRGFGLRNLRDCVNYGELKLGLSSEVAADLIIAAAIMPGGDVPALISQYRSGEIGNNPFVPIIMMTWNADAGVIKAAVDCGVDYILAAPVAPADVFKRIDLLVNNRKPFVVTSDYIGPDRRRDPSRGDSSIPLIDVPNTLRAKSMGEDMDMTSLESAIGDTMSEINEQRLVRHSYQVNLLVEMILPAYETGDVAPVIRVHMDKLCRVAEEVSDRLLGSKFEHVSELCQNLRDVTASISARWENPNRKDVELLRPLSQAILASFNPERDSTEMAGEITGMVSKFAGKINEEAEQLLA